MCKRAVEPSTQCGRDMVALSSDQWCLLARRVELSVQLGQRAMDDGEVLALKRLEQQRERAQGGAAGRGGSLLALLHIIKFKENKPSGWVASWLAQTMARSISAHTLGRSCMALTVLRTPSLP